MISRILRRSVRSTNVARFQQVRSFADEAAASNDGLSLTFAVPHRALYEKAAVELVRLPGVSGEFGITAGHTPNISQLVPGVVRVYPEKEGEPEEWFVSGGYAMTHPDNSLDVAAVEVCALEDLDAATVTANLAESKARMESAPEGSSERASAQIEVECNTAMAQALGEAA
eukprot:g1374.t1